MKKFYLDDPEIGPDPATSHPRFNELMKDEFYTDCLDEFSPFGNDDGADTLYNLEDWYRETKGKADIVAFMFDHIDGFGFKYACDGCVQSLDLEFINQLQQEDEFFIDCMDKAIIATVFGQLKIEGKIAPALKELGIIALERQKLVTLQRLANNEVDLSKLFKIVDGKSTRENEEGNTNHLQDAYLERLEIMKKDLEKYTK
ncbi:hypothetical protein Q0590_10025 [Rhodocytophaga aerolata]|uniref:DUF4375 domain-containing protein n=1 Tax=Rhodocytophaga aerolata TaxID=455078 RepID=A0ABT8R5N9_9BACT|nr:hypothetical protein [Rhodocytophaga aerolata]MDO1446588.1 hypothetical protein [Rhodocytophaga aerolata]